MSCPYLIGMKTETRTTDNGSIPVVLIRHAQSQWNRENRFTGWANPPLTEAGIAEAVRAGQWLSANGYRFDVAYSSRLQRAISTLDILLEQLRQSDIPRYLERNPGRSFVAREHELLVGTVLCGHDGRRGYIDQLVVRESHRRQGIGRSLVSRCLFNLMRIGIRKWNLFVLEDNQEAIAFWTNLGWAERLERISMTQYKG